MRLLPVIRRAYSHVGRVILRAVDWLSAALVPAGRVREASVLPSGPHDCSLHALSEVIPDVDMNSMRDAFLACAKEWPYGGVTNREFHMALNFLGIEHTYHHEDTTLGEILANEKGKCVALVDYHFIATNRGRVVGRDAGVFTRNIPTRIYCYWTFP